MRYVTELSDGSRYISSSSDARDQLIWRLKGEDRFGLIVREYTWDETTRLAPEVKPGIGDAEQRKRYWSERTIERMKRLQDTMSPDGLTPYLIRRPGEEDKVPDPPQATLRRQRVSQAAERRARRVGFTPRGLPTDAEKRHLRREVARMADERRYREKRADAVRKRIEERVKATHPDAKFYWSNVD